MNSGVSAAWAKIHGMIKGFIAMLPSLVVACCLHNFLFRWTVTQVAVEASDLKERTHSQHERW